MRIIKLAFISFTFIFLVVTAISLMIPSRIRISKATNLPNSRDSILALVNNEGQWSRWHPAFMNDSFRRAANLKVIPQSHNDSEVVALVRQGEKKGVVNGWKIYSHQGSDSLTLQWYMDFRLSWYPWQKFGSLFYENTYGVLMQEGLSNIKRTVK